MTKYLLIVFFIWIFLEGILRKWFLSGLATQLFLVKYLLSALIFIYYFSQNSQISKKIYPFFPLIIVYVLWCVFEFFNDEITTNLNVKIIGLITHLCFITFIFVIPTYLNSKKKIIRLFTILAYISLPVFILGLIQYSSPVGSVINKYVYEDVNIATISGNPRITAVFSYITPYTSFLSFSIIIFLYLIIIKSEKKINKLFFYLVFILGVTNLFMTGSRHPVLILIFSVLIFIFYLFLYRSHGKGKIFFGLISIIIISFVFILYSDVGSESFSAFKERLETTGDFEHRIKDNYNVLTLFDNAGLIGYGLGTTYQGSKSLIHDQKDMPYVESENSRLIVEFGILGFIIVVLLRISIFLYSYKVYLNTSENDLKLLMVFLLIYQLPVVLSSSNIIYNYMGNILYWFIVGLVVSINIINNKQKLYVNNYLNQKKEFVRNI